MADSDAIAITLRCFCRAHSFTSSVPATSLPLEASCCHCDSCRHLTGALFFPCVEWPNREEDLSSLQRYDFSKNVQIFFCSTCFTPKFSYEPKDPWLGAFTGPLENTPNLVKYTNHIFVGDTIDGGASMWLRKAPDGTAVKRWTGWTKKRDPSNPELPHEWPSLPAAPSAEEGATPDLTPFKCHCGGVNLVLRSAKDLASRPASELPFFIHPQTQKYLASTDACDSCRLQFGVDLPNWTFALLSHIDFPADVQSTEEFPRSFAALREATSKSEPRNPALGTLKSYQSSPDVDRYSCSRCSASVFYAVEDRPDMVDLAVGLLHHPSGARAEGLLNWNLGRVGWTQDADGGWREHLCKQVLANVEEWKSEQGPPKESAKSN